LAIQLDGKILVGGRSLQRLNADGVPDLTFIGPDDVSDIGAIAVTTDQKIIVTGMRPLGFGAYAWGAYRLDQDGVLKTVLGSAAYSLVVQPDQKLVTGTVSINRVNPDGTPDAGFVPTQLAAVLEEIRAFALQPDGKILFGGRVYNVQGHPCVLVGR